MFTDIGQCVLNCTNDGPNPDTQSSKMSQISYLCKNASLIETFSCSWPSVTSTRVPHLQLFHFCDDHHLDNLKIMIVFIIIIITRWWWWGFWGRLWRNLQRRHLPASATSSSSYHSANLYLQIPIRIRICICICIGIFVFFYLYLYLNDAVSKEFSLFLLA